MLPLSYSFSSELRSSLQKIETLRQTILLTPLSPQTLLRLRWDAMLSRVHWSLKPEGITKSKAESAKWLSQPGKKKTNPRQLAVINYQKALSFIHQDWLVSPKSITPQTILTLHQLVSPPPKNLSAEAKREITHLLEYLQAGTEHPIIQAGIAYAHFLYLNPFEHGNGRLARLIPLVFLYKYGYDFRGLLVLEGYWYRNQKIIHRLLKSSQNNNLTLWLEFFSQAVASQLQKATPKLSSARFQKILPASFWQLSDRHQEIITLLDKPGSTISNKKVQKLFKVSQITASRDLGKLTTLGLLFTHGKGRSVYYTKV